MHTSIDKSEPNPPARPLALARSPLDKAAGFVFLRKRKEARSTEQAGLLLASGAGPGCMGGLGEEEEEKRERDKATTDD